MHLTSVQNISNSKTSIYTIYLCLFFALFIDQAKAQDYHYSLINNQPLVLNPALTGVFDFDFKHKDLRFASLYRQQWTTISSHYLDVPKPYHTTSFSIDGILKRNKEVHGDYVGLGMSLAHDQAGDLKFKSQQINFSISYNKVLNRKRTRFITLGFQGGLVNRSVNYTDGYFDNQWNGTSFNPALPTGENFPTDAYNYSDLSTGLVYEQFDEGKPKFMVGVAYFHFNNPAQRFYNESATKLGAKYVVHGLLDYPLSQKRDLVSHLVYSTQNGKSKTNIGSYYKLKTYEDKIMKQSIQLGGGLRITGDQQNFASLDAIYLGLKMSKASFLWGASYDINTSKLAGATSTVGSFELSVIYYIDLYKSNHKLKKRRNKFKPKCID